MRIALVAPVALPVPPTGYGGTELVVAQLADGLARRGHDVALYASGDSRTRARLRARFPVALEADGVADAAVYDRLERDHVAWAFADAAGADVIHDHTKANGVALADTAGPPVVTTVHNDLTPARRAAYGARPGHRYVAISAAQAAKMPALNWVGVVHNGLDLAPTTFRARKDGYLLFLGRLDAAKGADVAARVAARLDLPLVMAGRIAKERAFFETEVAPWLDGRRRRYVGEVAGQAKWDLYAGAAALLFPIQWDEPFGLVMIEAMACGTPVIATRRGAVPEVVADGETGLVLPADADDAAIAAAVAGLGAIDPHACRARVEACFSAERMVESYEGIYRELAQAPAIAGP